MKIISEIIATQELTLEEMKADREGRTACQEATEVNTKKMEPTPEMI
jgi:hypothetical protein